MKKIPRLEPKIEKYRDFVNRKNKMLTEANHDVTMYLMKEINMMTYFQTW